MSTKKVVASDCNDFLHQFAAAMLGFAPEKISFDQSPTRSGNFLASWLSNIRTIAAAVRNICQPACGYY